MIIFLQGKNKDSAEDPQCITLENQCIKVHVNISKVNSLNIITLKLDGNASEKSEYVAEYVSSIFIQIQSSSIIFN